MLHSRSFLIAAVLAGAVACASTQAGTAAGGRGAVNDSVTARSTVSRDANLITEEEIRAEASASNAFDLIRRLRPAFLRTRGATTFNDPSPDAGYPSIFVNKQYYGGFSTLPSIATETLTEIRYVPAAEASPMFGARYPAGVISIKRR